jgi:hypothetical protein
MPGDGIRPGALYRGGAVGVRGGTAAAARQVPGALAVHSSAPTSERGRRAKVLIAKHRWRLLEVGFPASLTTEKCFKVGACVESSVQEGYGHRDGRMLRPKVRSSRN